MEFNSEMVEKLSKLYLDHQLSSIDFQMKNLDATLLGAEWAEYHVSKELEHYVILEFMYRGRLRQFSGVGSRYWEARAAALFQIAAWMEFYK